MSVVNVIILTLNEELSIATAINDFRREVPSANIYFLTTCPLIEQ